MATSIALMGLLTLGGFLMLRRQQQRTASGAVARQQATSEAGG
jgi:MYXO-CTERM domain-containing protein